MDSPETFTHKRAVKQRATRRQLGDSGEATLQLLRAHGRWYQHPKLEIPWVWQTRSQTQRAMTSLVRRGLARTVLRELQGVQVQMFFPADQDNQVA